MSTPPLPSTSSSLAGPRPAGSPPAAPPRRPARGPAESDGECQRSDVRAHPRWSSAATGPEGWIASSTLQRSCCETQLLLHVQARTRGRALSVDARAAGRVRHAGRREPSARGRPAPRRPGVPGLRPAVAPTRVRPAPERPRASRLVGRNVVTVSESRGLLTPPTVDCAADNVARGARGRSPRPPRGLPSYPGPDGT